MTITLTPNLTLISECDSITDWDADATVKTPTLDTEFFKETTGSVSALLNSDKTPADYNFMRYTPPAANLDLRNTHVYFQFNTAQVPFLYTKASGGIRFEIEDVSSNKGGWYLDGIDTYDGGWKGYVVDTAKAFDNGTGYLSAVDKISVHIFLSNVSAKAAINTWVDAIRYGFGLTIGSGTSSVPGTFSEIDSLDNDDTRMYGVFKEYGGIYFSQGKLTFGSGNTIPTYFKDADETVVFKDTLVSGNLYEIIVSGSKTVFQLGSKTGDVGIEGCTISQETLSEAGGYWQFDASSNTISGCRLYGSNFYNASAFYLPGSSDANETRSCNFNACGMIYPSSSIFAKNNIISSTDRAITMISGHKISSCSFISCPSGIVINSSGDYTFDDLTFAGCTKDIVNASTSWVSANCVNGSNPSTYINTNGGSTAIVNAVYLTVNVEDTSGYAISTAAVAVYSGSTELVNEFTSTAGQAQATYNYPGNDVPITIRIRKSTPASGTRYVPIKTTGTITSDGFTLTSVMTTDSIAT